MQQGELKRGYEVGKKSQNLYVYRMCEDCGGSDWVEWIVSENRPSSSRCKPCALKRRRGERRGPAHNRLSLVGQRFTRLTVLAYVSVEEAKRQSVWLCKCDCGNEANVVGSYLTSGNVKSCGCYHAIRTRELFSGDPAEMRITKILCDYRKRSRIKGHEFSLSRSRFAALLDLSCHYCGAEPSNILTNHGQELRYQGIDRLDNDLGYVEGNVVPCCIVCNKMKKTMNYDEFISHVRRIADRFNVDPSPTPQSRRPQATRSAEVFVL